MMHRSSQRGFTIVELIVVIVVIAILAAITLVAYDSIQKRAMDAKIISTLDDVGKALMVKELDGIIPASHGYWSNSGGVDDTIIPDFVQEGYRKDITSVNVADSTTRGNLDNSVYRYYRCATGGFGLFASLNKPTSEDISNLASIKSSSRCNISDSSVPISGSWTYNYGKVFK